MSYEVSKQEMEDEVEGLLDALTNPEFLKKMVEFKSKKGEVRMAFASTEMTPAALTGIGINLPANMKVSSRTFDEANNPLSTFVDYDRGATIINNINANNPALIAKLKVADPLLYEGLRQIPGVDMPQIPNTPTEPLPGNVTGFPPINPIDLVSGVSGCACGGGLTFCGGAGGGTT